jgi:hypothetical protein
MTGSGIAHGCEASRPSCKRIPIRGSSVGRVTPMADHRRFRWRFVCRWGGLWFLLRRATGRCTLIRPVHFYRSGSAELPQIRRCSGLFSLLSGFIRVKFSAAFFYFGNPFLTISAVRMGFWRP